MFKLDHNITQKKDLPKFLPTEEVGILKGLHKLRR